jgi:putative FmdB family regulatory protein
MPDYDFRCKECHTAFTLTYATYAEHDQAIPICPKCGSDSLSHVIQRVAMLTGEESRMERLADPSRFAGLDDNDPRSVAHLMREMAGESGVDMGAEFNEVVDRLDAGESPESIEKTLPLPDADSPLPPLP